MALCRRRVALVEYWLRSKPVCCKNSFLKRLAAALDRYNCSLQSLIEARNLQWH
ncbi:UNVERIFIED_CONTAM: hypothetical protein FKN15_026407 [Acipenser sinensis]